MAVPAALLDLIREFESLHDGDRSTPLLEPQRDPRGIPTLGWGAIYDRHGRRVTMETPAITREEADELLARDSEVAVRAVRRLIRVPLAEHQLAALADFTYNLGSGQLQISTLRKRLNAGNYDAVPSELKKWVYSGGVKLSGLVRRRGREAALWLDG